MQVLSRDANLQNDETFLSLLSSQRELLTQLTMETAMRNQVAAAANAAVPLKDYSYRENRMYFDHQQKYRRSSIDFLFSKRLSMGMSMGLDYALPTISTDEDPYEDYYGYKSFSSGKMGKLEDFSESYHVRKKRRLSSLGLGFLGPSFFEDNLQTSRRDSVLGVSAPIKCESDELITEVIIDGDASDDEEDSEEYVKENDKAPNSSAPADKVKAKIEMIEPEEAKSIMESFSKAMELSQKTQQDIHDWDRKMGLKRSHSKTMRQSSRSRKKLRSTFKKEISLLVSKV